MRNEEIIRLLSEETNVNISRITLINSPEFILNSLKEIYVDNSPTSIEIQYSISRGLSPTLRSDFSSILSEWRTWCINNI